MDCYHHGHVIRAADVWAFAHPIPPPSPLEFASRQVVFYMPNEEVLKKDDLSRELCFVLHGACLMMQEDRVKRVVRDDVRDNFPLSPLSP